jgi:hypothetical protein
MVHAAFNVYLRNNGEINIREFKILGHYSQTFDTLKDINENWKDGWQAINDDAEIYTDESPEIMQLNVYPHDRRIIQSTKVDMRHKTSSPHNVFLDWTIFLENTTPIRGVINMGEVFAHYARKMGIT